MKKSKKPVKNKIILDTSCLVAAILAEQGISAKLFEKIVKREMYNFYTDEILEELRGVLAREKFQLSKEKQEQFLNLVQEVSFLVQQYELYMLTKCRDPKDDKFLSLANQISADFIITLDKDLLSLERINKTEIITPAKFIEGTAER
ncbi:MAG: putative toxin-antitoxin system toxin component, PIN family [Nanoarchaeota archaeon]